jgi:hypothetical protein
MTTAQVTSPAAVPAALPAVLVTPRWTTRRPEPIVIGGLRCDAEPTVEARAGESPASLHALSKILSDARVLPSDLINSLLPYVSVDVAEFMAEKLERSTVRSVRESARAWVLRHPLSAARALVPAAVGLAGPARAQAERVLRLLAGAGRREAVDRAAASYGPSAVAAVAAVVDGDPLDLLPAKIPGLPRWADPATLPPVRLRDGGVLPPDAVRHLLTMLAISRVEEPYAGLADVRRVCQPGSLAELGRALWQRWLDAEMPSASRWVLDAQGLVGDDETARKVSLTIRSWRGTATTTRTSTGLDVLATIGSDVALMHLQGIADKAGHRGLRLLARRRIAELADAAGITLDELGDRLVPNLGLDPTGRTRLDYGRRAFVVGFDEQLRPYVLDADGKRRASLPKLGAQDDPTLAPAAYARFAGLKKDVRTVAADQIRRLERALVRQRRWEAPAFRRYLLDHPLMQHLVRRLLCATFEASGAVRSTFRVAEDRSLADLADEPVALPADAIVGLAHPLHLGADLPAWSEVFADYELLQPFPQLAREVYTVTGPDADRGTLARFEGRVTHIGRIGALERRGWLRGSPGDGGMQSELRCVLAGGVELSVDLDPGIFVGDPAAHIEQTLGTVRLASGRFAEQDPIAISEAIRDIEEICR